MLEKGIELLVLLLLLAVAFTVGILVAPLIFLGLMYPPLLIVPLLILLPVIVAVLVWIVWMLIPKPTS